MNVCLCTKCEKCVLCIVWCIIVNLDPDSDSSSGLVLQHSYGLLMRSQTCQKLRRPQTTDDCAYRGWETRWYFPDLLRWGIWMSKRKNKNKPTVTNVYETKQSCRNCVGFLQYFISRKGASRGPHTFWLSHQALHPEASYDWLGKIHSMAKRLSRQRGTVHQDWT